MGFSDSEVLPSTGPAFYSKLVSSKALYVIQQFLSSFATKSFLLQGQHPWPQSKITTSNDSSNCIASDTNTVVMGTEVRDGATSRNPAVRYVSLEGLPKSCQTPHSTCLCSIAACCNALPESEVTCRFFRVGNDQKGRCESKEAVSLRLQIHVLFYYSYCKNPQLQDI